MNIQIRNITISIGKLTVCLIIFSCLLVVSRSFSENLFLLLIGGFITLFVSVIYFSIKKGVLVTLKRFTRNGSNYELRGYFNFLKPQNNYKVIVTPQGYLDSKTYVNSNFGKWGYFDEIRIILEQYISKNKIKNLNILILGGGLGSIAGSMAVNPNVSKIKMVEISKQVVSMAEAHSLNSLKPHLRNKITTINSDAIKYIFDVKEKFDIVFIDLFNEGTIVSDVYDLPFLQRIKDLLNTKGLVITNLGILPDSRFIEGTTNFKFVFDNYKIYYLRVHSFLSIAAKTDIKIDIKNISSQIV